MDASTKNAASGSTLWWPMVVHIVLAIGVLWVIARSPTLQRPRRWLIGIMVADLLLLTALCSLSYSKNDGNIEPSPQVMSSLPGGHPGRMAILDSGLSDFQTYVKLGAPNLNVFTKQPSVQGYGSLIGEYYGNATGTHPLLGLDSCELGRGRFAQLNLRTIVASISALSEPVPSSSPAPPTCNGSNRPAGSVRRYFGQELAVTGFTASTSLPNTRFDVVLVPARLSDTNAAFFSNVTYSFTLSSDEHGVVSFAPLHFPHNDGGAYVSAGITLAPSRPAGSMMPARAFTISSLVVGDAEGRTYELNEPYQVALQDAGFTYSGTSEGYAVFHNSASGTLSASNGAIITHHETKIWGDEWARVSVPVGGATLTRSSAWLPGWRATAVNTQTGKSVSLFVKRSDLVQSVRVPAGTWRLHFHYHAPFIGLGVLSSALGTLALFVSAAVLRRHRKNTLAE
jgi:hypothetical protein